MKVRKRDNTIVDFDLNKINVAIRKAFLAVGRNFNEEEILTLGNIVKSKISKDLIDIEEIQDLVESVLLENEYEDVFKDYVTYRKKRSLSRELLASDQQDFFTNLETIGFESITNFKLDNKYYNDPYKMIFNYGSVLSKQYTLAYLLDERINLAHKNKEIFLVDLDFYPSVALENVILDYSLLEEKKVVGLDNYLNWLFKTIIINKHHNYGDHTIYNFTSLIKAKINKDASVDDVFKALKTFLDNLRLFNFQNNFNYKNLVITIDVSNDSMDLLILKAYLKAIVDNDFIVTNLNFKTLELSDDIYHLISKHLTSNLNTYFILDNKYVYIKDNIFTTNNDLIVARNLGTVMLNFEKINNVEDTLDLIINQYQKRYDLVKGHYSNDHLVIKVSSLNYLDDLNNYVKNKSKNLNFKINFVLNNDNNINQHLTNKSIKYPKLEELKSCHNLVLTTIDHNNFSDLKNIIIKLKELNINYFNFI